MRLVESSDPTAVPRAEAEDMLYERLALADAVASALDVAEGRYVDPVARAALGHLRAWVSARYNAAPDKESSPGDGLDQMVVPSGVEEVMNRLHRATAVARCLAMLYTADTNSEFESDSEHISRALDAWRKCRVSDPTAWRNNA